VNGSIIRECARRRCVCFSRDPGDHPPDAKHVLGAVPEIRERFYAISNARRRLDLFPAQ
jgi:hypothetical protein